MRTTDGQNFKKFLNADEGRPKLQKIEMRTTDVQRGVVSDFGHPPTKRIEGQLSVKSGKFLRTSFLNGPYKILSKSSN